MRVQFVSPEGDPATLAVELRRPGAAEGEDVAAAVAETIAAVREGGDQALRELSVRFDGATSESLWVPENALDDAVETLDSALRDALETSIANVRAVAEGQIRSPSGPKVTLRQGQSVVIDEVPVGSAAIYVPAGKAPYPSSVVMGVVPAQVAGVERVVVASPPGPSGVPADAILAAAALCGADGVLAAGGAQAIAALAHGTETVAPVDVIAGPGSPWVQEAKLQCSRVIGIDGYAGPSELLVIADADADPRWLALDLMAQAEHGPNGLLVAASPDESLLRRLGEEIESASTTRPTVTDALVSLVQVDDLAEALALAESLAPEHLQIDCAGSADLGAQASTAGCVFIGPRSATAFGDYAAGSNHVLPTGGAGRFSGPLGPGTFRRRISRVSIDADAAAELAPTVDTIARAEGFVVHAESAVARTEGRSPDAERE